MDKFGEWRQIEPSKDDDAAQKKAHESPVAASGGRDLRFVGAIAGVVMLAVGAYVWLTMPAAPSGVTLAGSAEVFDPGATGVVATPAASEEQAALEILVDVEGAVISPGLHRLPAGSRVGDAIAAAGGYSPRVDVAAATTALNLAERLVDGVKVHVPVRGESIAGLPSFVAEQPAGVQDGGSSGSLVNLNTATAEQLDTLPGVGPVTAAKIIAARDSGPFASIDELVSRDVLGAATLEKLRALVTVGP